MHRHKGEIFDAFNMPPCSLEPLDPFDAREWRLVHAFRDPQSVRCLSFGVEVNR